MKLKIQYISKPQLKISNNKFKNIKKLYQNLKMNFYYTKHSTKKFTKIVLIH